jgi:hypothetical protein
MRCACSGVNCPRLRIASELLHPFRMRLEELSHHPDSVLDLRVGVAVGTTLPRTMR